MQESTQAHGSVRIQPNQTPDSRASLFNQIIAYPTVRLKLHLIQILPLTSFPWLPFPSLCMAHVIVLSSSFHSLIYSFTHSTFTASCSVMKTGASSREAPCPVTTWQDQSSYARCLICLYFHLLGASSHLHAQGLRVNESFLYSDHQSHLTIQVRHMEIQQAAKQAGAEIAGRSGRQSRAGKRVHNPCPSPCGNPAEPDFLPPPPRSPLRGAIC